MESLEMSMVGFPLQVWKDILFLWEKVNLCAAFSKTKKNPNPQNLYTTFFSLSTCLLKKEVAIFTRMGRFYTPLSQYITSHMSLFLAGEQLVCCNAHQTSISLISIVHRSTLRMNLCMFRKHSDSMLNKCCKTTSIYSVQTISKHNFNSITAAEHLQILFKMWIFTFYSQYKITTTVSRRDH